MNTTIDPLIIAAQYAEAVPVPIFDILGEFGLGPEFADMDDNISGWIEQTNEGSYSVAINRRHALVRQRFTAAHELGHYIYHRDLLGAGVGDTRAYRAENTPLPNNAIRPVHERQANSFAANLLMPRQAISMMKAHGIIDPAVLAEHFCVSQEAMRIRLGLSRLGSS
jgi:Zn-dependent peptidase ImmA (M78 family)